MDSNDEILDQQKEEQFPKGLPFGVPEGYFDGLGSRISARIALNEKLPSENGSSAAGFTVPLEYFEHLPNHIEFKISEKEFEKNIEPEFFKNQSEAILQKIAFTEKYTSKTPFETPPNYFDSLANKIELKTHAIEKKSIRPIMKLHWAYAAAAAIVLSFGIYFYAPKTEIIPIAVEKINTDSLSTADIISTLQTSDISEDELITHIDIKDLPDHIIIEEKDLDKVMDEIDESDLLNEM
ncbi:MAG: hypothetical protein ABL927_12335 [Bdellovibrionales bacterium]